jgi:hypothetical protein
MIFDDLPLWAMISASILIPPLITMFCWFAGPRLAGHKMARVWEKSRKELWLMLLASYLIFAVAGLGAHYLEVRDSGNAAQSFQ